MKTNSWTTAGQAKDIILHKVLKTNPFHCLSYQIRYPSGRKVGPLCETVGRINTQQMGPLYRSTRIQDTIQGYSPSFIISDKSESIFLPVTARRDRRTFPEMGSEKGTRSGTPHFYSRLFLVPKKNGKLRPVIDLSLLNQYIMKQPFKMETVKSVHEAILVHDWTISIDLTDVYLHVLIHPWSRKYLRFMFEGQVFQFTVLPFGISLSLWIFT